MAKGATMSLTRMFKSSKNSTNAKNYKETKGKNSARKPKQVEVDLFEDSPKFEVPVVSSIQNKRVVPQEDLSYRIISSRTRQKSQKYKGRKAFNKTEPRSKSYKGRNAYQKKRSMKREEKEVEDNQSESEEQSFSNKNQQLNKKNKTVSFKNSYSKNGKVSRKRSNLPSASVLDSYCTKRRKTEVVPPKSKLQKQMDKEWLESAPKELSNQQKSYLLSIEDQAERNRELSQMTDMIEASTSALNMRLAGQPYRKSLINNKSKQSKTTRNASVSSKFDERLYQKFNKNYVSPRKTSNDSSRDVESSASKDNKGALAQNKAIEIISQIRSRGQQAQAKHASKKLKNTPDRKLCKTPQSKGKISPIPFPDFEEDTKPQTKVTLPTEEVPMELEETPKSTQEKQDKPKEQEENKPVAVIEKVQNSKKDVSLPVVSEIQRKSLRDSSYDVAPMQGAQPAKKLTPIPVSQQPKQVITTIKEQYGNIRSPAKLTNKMISPGSGYNMCVTPSPSSEFKTPLPKKVKTPSPMQPKAKEKDVITTFPFRVQMREILKEYDDLVLPKKLQLILDFFTELDNAINNCKRRGKLPIMSNLKPYIEQSTNRTFDVEHFQKVYYVAPELYYYTWYQPAKSSQPELRVEIPENIEEILGHIEKKAPTVSIRYSPFSEPMTNFVINKRRIVVRSRLILYVENMQKKYLNNVGITDYDYVKEKAWHPGFDLENIMDLPLKSLKNVPKSKKTETISEFLKNKNIKNTLLKRASEKTNDASSAYIQNDSQSTLAGSSLIYTSSEKRSPAKINNATISPTFYKRIETKEKMYEEEKKHLEQESKRGELRRKQELMLKIAQAVKSVFSVKGKVNTLFLNNVLKYLNDSQRGNFYDKKELIATLKEISHIVPEWLTLKQHDKGFLVKI